MNKFKHYFERLKNYKPADKPHKRKKNWTPPGQVMKRTGIFFIWMWAALVTLVIVATMAQSRTAEDVEQVFEEPEVNQATTVAATEFAKQFAKIYFTWEASPEGFTARKEALAPMIANGLDEQAGLLMNGQEWNSTTGSMHVVEVRETGEQKAMITLEVGQTLTREVDEKKETERVRHLFTVPVGFATAYGIYDLPNFSAVPAQTALEMEYLQGDAVEGEVKNNIKNFLTTFFTSYTTDAPDSLAYFMDTEAPQGLEGAKELVEVRATTVVQVGERYLVETAIVLQDPTTKVQYLAHYTLELEQQGNRYMVVKLNEGAE